MLCTRPLLRLRVFVSQVLGMIDPGACEEEEKEEEDVEEEEVLSLAFSQHEALFACRLV